jgi:two-component system, OmpR family, sensor histidine kinase TctE
VNQLLALARAEAGAAAMTRQPCNLVALATEVLQDCLPRALDRHIDLGLEGAGAASPGVSLEGNPTLLKEMIRNLIDNAIAYTPSSPERPGVITVRVLPKTDGQALTLQVEDSGPGIAPAERQLVFQPFYRALGNEADGSGLGLPIVKEIATQHHADVWLEDARAGQTPAGARFSVYFRQTVGGS